MDLLDHFDFVQELCSSSRKSERLVQHSLHVVENLRRVLFLSQVQTLKTRTNMSFNSYHDVIASKVHMYLCLEEGISVVRQRKLLENDVHSFWTVVLRKGDELWEGCRRVATVEFDESFQNNRCASGRASVVRNAWVGGWNRNWRVNLVLTPNTGGTEN